MLPDIFFAGPGLDRADALRPQAERIAALAHDPAARELKWLDGFPAVDRDGRIEWGEVGDPALFLGLDQGQPRFSALPPDPSVNRRAPFALLAQLDERDAPTFAAALSLGNWHRSHRFCSTCGQPSEMVRGGWSRRCPSCRAEHYPRVDPVVIMLAIHRDRVLLGRQPQYPPGRYSALAGYVEVGETIEAAVARELFEEAGIAVGGVTYVASQPWPFPSTLMIACTAHAADDALTIDRTEIDDARWFSRSEVGEALAGELAASFLPPPPYAIARTLLEHWLAA